MEATGKQAGQRQSKKTIEEVVEYAISHRTRILVLSVLNEGTYTKEEIARIIGQPQNRVSHHIRELLDGGSIELARVEKARNAERHYYRSVRMPFFTDEEVEVFFTDEEVEEWAPLERQIGAGICIQNFVAEMIAALSAGKFREDPRHWLSWRWFNVDAEGRNALADEQQRFWDRCCEIAEESINRCANSGEETESIVIGGAGFERVRKAPPGDDILD